MNDVKDWLILLRATGLGAVGFHKLVDRFGTPEKILAASRGQFSELGFSQQTIAAIQQPDFDAIQLDLEWLNAADNHHIITLLDPQYPPLLKSIVHPPPVLFVRGDPDYLQQPQLAMVGSRNPTAAGRRTASDFAKYLSTSGITITSGLASGIDGASHQGALQGIAGTIALVAHGLDIVYPAAHRALAEEIANHGAVVSEMPIGTEPHRGLFPRRNRIISGISLGTLVVEAALKSGSLITAKHALEQSREVFAIPGSIHNPLARGCHQLIRQGAKLVETAEDIIEELLPYTPASVNSEKEPSITRKKEQTLDPDHLKLLKCLQYEAIAIDELVDRSGFSAAEVASMLLIMELEGTIVCKGGRYTRIK